MIKISKNKEAVKLGRKGGISRAKRLSKIRMREIARIAANIRWIRYYNKPD